jgi:hypothetical protein
MFSLKVSRKSTCLAISCPSETLENDVMVSIVFIEGGKD